MRSFTDGRWARVIVQQQAATSMASAGARVSTDSPKDRLRREMF